jgi:hypothetical protein
VKNLLIYILLIMSLTGLLSGYFTDIDVIDSIAINGNVGTANQVLTSDGTNTDWAGVPPAPTAAILTAGTGIDITATGNPETISTNVKSLVLDGTAVVAAPQTFNPNANGGSQTITINDTDTTYTATQPIAITVGNDIQLQYDNDTIILDGGDIAVAKVPNALTAGTNITFSSGTTYDGSAAITISSTDTNTTYTAGTNLNLSGTTFNLNSSLTSINLLDSTNIVSPYFLHDVYDPSTADVDSLSTSYVAVFGGNLKNSFTAQSDQLLY